MNAKSGGAPQQQVVRRPLVTATGRRICPKCIGGELYQQRDGFGWFLSCGLCGYEYSLGLPEAQALAAQTAARRSR